MSILQLASPQQTSRGIGSSSALMLPPASPLILGQHAPPPSPAHPPHLQHQQQHTSQQQQAQARAHAQAQAQLLALVAEGRESDAAGSSTHAAEDVDAGEDEGEGDDQHQQMSDDDEDYDDQEDRASNSSQSCPPSPLANASTADAGAVGSGSGVLAGRRKQAASGRRRSVGSSSVHERDPEAGSGRVYKRPSAKVSQVAGSPAFKKRTGGEGTSGAAGGSSCHQCKSRRAYMDLTYCTSALGKKKGAVCRKKYCGKCAAPRIQHCARSLAFHLRFFLVVLRAAVIRALRACLTRSSIVLRCVNSC